MILLRTAEVQPSLIAICTFELELGMRTDHNLGSYGLSLCQYCSLLLFNPGQSCTCINVCISCSAERKEIQKTWNNVPQSEKVMALERKAQARENKIGKKFNDIKDIVRMAYFNLLSKARPEEKNKIQNLERKKEKEVTNIDNRGSLYPSRIETNSDNETTAPS